MTKYEQTYLFIGLYRRLFEIRKRANDAVGIARKLDTPDEELIGALEDVNTKIKRHFERFHLQAVPTTELGEFFSKDFPEPTKQKCESWEVHFATDDAKQIPNPEKFGRVDNMQAVDVWGLYCAVGDILSWCRGRGRPAELPDDFIARAEATQDAVAKRFGFTDKKGER